MDHIWNSLKQWLDNWEEQLSDEMAAPYHEHQESNIKVLKADIEAIKKAMAVIHTRF